MFHPNDYKKTIDKMASATPEDIAEAMKPMANYQAKLSRITFDAAKKNLAAGQAMVNETIDSLDRFAKAGPAVADLAAASSEFTAEQAKTMPKYMAAFVDIAKTAQAEAMDVMLSAGKEAAMVDNDKIASQKAEAATPATIASTDDKADSTNDDTAVMADIKNDVMAKTTEK